MVLAATEWAGVVWPDGSLLESFARGTVVYFAVLALFRVMLTRHAGAVGLPDVMLVVLASEAVANGLVGEAKSVPNGLATFAALLFWSSVLDRLAYRYPWVRRLLEPAPVELVRDGKPNPGHMRAERVSDDDLQAQLRAAGVGDVADVRLAMLEGEGSVSVLPRDDVAELRRAVRELQEVVGRLQAVAPPGPAVQPQRGDGG